MDEKTSYLQFHGFIRHILCLIPSTLPYLFWTFLSLVLTISPFPLLFHHQQAQAQPSKSDQAAFLANSTLKIRCLNPKPSIFSHALAASVLSWKLMNANPLASPVSLSFAKKTRVTRPKRSNMSRSSCSSAISETFKVAR